MLSGHKFTPQPALCICVRPLGRALHRQHGFSLLEMVVTLGISSLLLGAAIANFRVLDDPLLNATNHVSGFYKEVRSRAISTTSAYRIELLNDQTLIARYSKRCDSPLESFVTDPRLILKLPNQTSVTSSEVTCFSARGLSSTSSYVTIFETSGPRSKTVEVFMAGAIREVE